MKINSYSKEESLLNRDLKLYISLISNISAGILGIVVILGWLTHTTWLIQIHESFVPMQFNTAFCFLLIALGLLLFKLYDNRLSKSISLLCAASVLAISSLTLIQYAFGVSFQIDELFMKHYVQTKTSHPGRMAPNTAVCFFVLGLLLLSYFFNKSSRLRNLFAWGLSVFVLVLSLVAIIGYLAEFEAAFGWQKYTRMALHTAMGFLVLAFGNVCSLIERKTILSQESWLPVPISISILSIFAILGQELKSNEVETIRLAAEDESEYVFEKIRLLSDQTFYAFKRLSDRLVYNEKMDQVRWRVDAASYIEDFKFFQAIEWIDQNHVVRWIEPMKGNEKLLGFDNKKSQIRVSEFEEARTSQKMLITQSFSLIQGGKGFLLIAPLYYKSTYKGSSVAVFKSEAFFGGLFESLNRQNLSIKISDGKNTLYNMKRDAASEELEIKAPLRFLKEDWVMSAVPTEKFVARYRTFLPEVVVFFGIVFSIFCGVLVFLYQQSVRNRKRFEIAAENLSTQKLIAENATQSKSQFLANMSHEIRTPMNAIIGLGDVLSDTRLDKEQQKYVEIIRKSGDSLLSLINDILDISKIESGKMTLVNDTFCLEDICDRVADIMAVQAAQKNIDFGVHIKLDYQKYFIGDPLRIRQILVNIIGNALKFTPDNGRVVLTVEKVLTKSNNEEITFHIEDSGKGIERENLESIFSSFTQENDGISKDFGGTGLGLAICKKIVTMMGGDISVKSEIGKGSEFLISLPLIESPDLENGSEKGVPSIDGKRVLVATEKVENGKILHEYIKGLGGSGFSFTDLEKVKEFLKYGEAIDIFMVDASYLVSDNARYRECISEIGSNKIQVISLSSGDHPVIDFPSEVSLSNMLAMPIKREDLYESLENIESGLSSEVGIVNGGLTEAKSDTIESSKLRILLVDDNEENRFVVRTYLKELSHDITELEDGKPAVESIKTQEYDLVLMDIRMKEMGGYEAIKLIREWEAKTGKPRVPVFALTAFAMESDRQKAIDSGFDGHLAKPIRKDELLDKINSFSSQSNVESKVIEEIPDDFKSLAPGYLSRRESDLKKLKDLLDESDFDGIESICHNVAGTAASYGFIELGKISKRIELAAESKEKEIIINLIAEFENCIQDCISRFAA